MAVQLPDEIKHYNPQLAAVDSEESRGGGRRVANRAALYALITTFPDKLKEDVTVVRVKSDSEFGGVATSLLLISLAQAGTAAGWERQGTGSAAVQGPAAPTWTSGAKPEGTLNAWQGKLYRVKDPGLASSTAAPGTFANSGQFWELVGYDDTALALRVTNLETGKANKGESYTKPESDARFAPITIATGDTVTSLTFAGNIFTLATDKGNKTVDLSQLAIRGDIITSVQLLGSVFRIITDAGTYDTDLSSLRTSTDTAPVAGDTVTSFGFSSAANVQLVTDKGTFNLDLSRFAVKGDTISGFSLAGDTLTLATDQGTRTVDLSRYLNRANHIGQQDIATVTGLQTALNNKVEKETGKGLSTNDYTTTEKQKLAGLQNFSLPTQTGNAGRVLKTNGTSPYWGVDESGTGGGGSFVGAATVRVELTSSLQILPIAPNAAGQYAVGVMAVASLVEGDSNRNVPLDPATDYEVRNPGTAQAALAILNPLVGDEPADRLSYVPIFPASNTPGGSYSDEQARAANDPRFDLVEDRVTTLEGRPSGGVTSFNGRTGAVIPTKADVGLGNVDNTADLSKPISTPTQQALDGKEPAFAKNTAHNKNFGVGFDDVARGNASYPKNESDAKYAPIGVATGDTITGVSLSAANVLNIATDKGTRSVNLAALALKGDTISSINLIDSALRIVTDADVYTVDLSSLRTTTDTAPVAGDTVSGLSLTSATNLRLTTDKGVFNVDLAAFAQKGDTISAFSLAGNRLTLTTDLGTRFVDLEISNINGLSTALGGKVDKVAGQGLITDAERAKLAGLSNYDATALGARVEAAEDNINTLALGLDAAYLEIEKRVEKSALPNAVRSIIAINFPVGVFTVPGLRHVVVQFYGRWHQQGYKIGANANTTSLVSLYRPDRTLVGSYLQPQDINAAIDAFSAAELLGYFVEYHQPGVDPTKEAFIKFFWSAQDLPLSSEDYLPVVIGPYSKEGQGGNGGGGFTPITENQVGTHPAFTDQHSLNLYLLGGGGTPPTTTESATFNTATAS